MGWEGVEVESNGCSMDMSFGISTLLVMTTHITSVVWFGFGNHWYVPRKDASYNIPSPTSSIENRLVLQWISGRMLSMCHDWLGS